MPIYLLQGKVACKNTSMNMKKLVAQRLQKTHMMQLATMHGDQPWCCSVYFVHDDDINLYWFSKPTTRHSCELEAHPKVAAAIPIVFAKGENVVGIQVEGDARKVESTQGEAAARLYAEKFGRSEQWVQSYVAGKTIHALYCLKPRHFAIFDEQEFPRDTYLEWSVGSE